MKKLVISIVCVMLATAATAANWTTRVLYWYSVNVDPNVPDISEIVTLEDKSDGAGVQLNWKVDGPNRTKAWMESNDAEADVWWADYQTTATSDIDEWTDREKAFAKVLLDEINLLRVQAGLAPRTLDQLKAAIKNKL